MKALSKYLLLLAAATCLGTAGLRAEDTDKPSKPERPEHKERGPKLTDEEKAKLKAARETAEKDPAVIAAKGALDKAREAKDRKASMEARKTHSEALKAAMIKADPSVAEILKKLPERPFGGGERGEGRGERGPRKGDKDAEKPADAPAKPAGE